VQKRKYQKGFYVSNSKHKKNAPTTDPIIKKKESQDLVLKTIVLPTAENDNLELSASVNDRIVTFKAQHSKITINGSDSLCDELILRNGNEIKVKVLEITPTQIKYKKCDVSDGPLYIANKGDVFMVKFSNGTKEVFKEEASEVNDRRTEKYTGPKKTQPWAIWAFVFAILGIFTYGIGSILAIIFANIAIKKIHQNPDRFDGETLAKAAKITGLVVLLIYASIIILALLLFGI